MRGVAQVTGGVSAAEQFRPAIRITLCRTRIEDPTRRGGNPMTASVAWHPVSGRSEVSLWLSVAAVVAAFVAMAVWFAVSASTSHSPTGTTPSVQQGGGADNSKLLCVPAPGTRYC
jgi:hypothetical protein